MIFMGMVEDGINSVKEAGSSVMDYGAEAGEGFMGELSGLNVNKYVGQDLKFPLNVEAADERHWIRFDMKKVSGFSIGEATDSATPATGGGLFKEGNLLDGLSRGVSALLNTALISPVNIINSVVGNFTDSLPPALGGILNSFVGTGQEKTTGLGSVTLYMPPANAETVSPNWAEESTGLAGGIIAGLGGTASGGVSGIMDAMKAGNVGSLAGQGAKVMAEKALGAASEAITGTDHTQFATRAAGQIQNPHMEAFFKGIGFRNYSFEFHLAPRNKPEAVAVYEIVKALKHASVPEYMSGIHGAYYAYPYIFDVTTFNQDKTHKIGRCALKGLSINHSAGGTNATFYDDYPMETSITMELMELEILHKEKVLKGY